MDEFLSKPVRAADLLAAIDRLVGHPESRAEKPRPIRHPPENRPGPDPQAPAWTLLDPEAILAACGGDPVILAKICKTFQDRLPHHLQAVERAIEQQDATGLRESAHRLRGIIAAFSSTAGTLAAELEEQGAHGHVNEAQTLLAELRPIARSLLREVDGISIQDLRRNSVATTES